MPTRKQSYNVILDERQLKRLTQLAINRACPRSAIVRTLIDNAYQMIQLHVPTCADGSKCFVPQMHQPNKQLPEQMNPAPDPAA